MRTGGCCISYFDMKHALLIIWEDATCHFWGKHILYFLLFSRFSSKFSSPCACFFHHTHYHILTIRKKVHVILKNRTVTYTSSFEIDNFMNSKDSYVISWSNQGLLLKKPRTMLRLFHPFPSDMLRAQFVAKSCLSKVFNLCFNIFHIWSVFQAESPA